MIHRILSHLRGQWIGVIALFIALGGTSYAAVSIPRNSVGTKQLRNGAVTPKKLSAKSFGGHILFTAQVNTFGKVLESQPRGATTGGWDSTQGNPPNGGVISWHRQIPKSCLVFADAQSTIQPGTREPGYASAEVVPGPAKTAFVHVFMPAPESVNVAVACPNR